MHLRSAIAVFVATFMIGCSASVPDREAPKSDAEEPTVIYADFEVKYHWFCDTPPEWAKLYSRDLDKSVLPPGRTEEEAKKAIRDSHGEWYEFMNVGNRPLTRVKLTMSYVEHYRGRNQPKVVKNLEWDEWQPSKAKKVTADTIHDRIEFDGTALIDGKKVMIKVAFTRTNDHLNDQEWRRVK